MKKNENYLNFFLGGNLWNVSQNDDLGKSFSSRSDH